MKNDSFITPMAVLEYRIDTDEVVDVDQKDQGACAPAADGGGQQAADPDMKQSKAVDSRT